MEESSSHAMPQDRTATPASTSEYIKYEDRLRMTRGEAQRRFGTRAVVARNKEREAYGVMVYEGRFKASQTMAHACRFYPHVNGQPQANQHEAGPAFERRVGGRAGKWKETIHLVDACPELRLLAGAPIGDYLDNLPKSLQNIIVPPPPPVSRRPLSNTAQHHRAVMP
jgi:hypothetical protein